MAKIDRTKTAPVNEDRVPFAEDESIVGYQFINTWHTRDGEEVVSKTSGDFIRSLSPLFKGGGANGMSPIEVNQGLIDQSLVAFVNGAVIVYRKREGQTQQRTKHVTF